MKNMKFKNDDNSDFVMCFSNVILIYFVAKTTSHFFQISNIQEPFHYAEDIAADIVYILDLEGVSQNGQSPAAGSAAGAAAVSGFHFKDNTTESVPKNICNFLNFQLVTMTEEGRYHHEGCTKYEILPSIEH